jgi:hypothetical protein
VALAAKIDILLGANTRGLDRGFKKGTTLTKRFANATRLNGQTLKNVGGFFANATGRALKYGAALTAVAAGAATVLIKKQFALIDTTAKLSDRLNVATEGLTGLQYAASLAGSSGEKLGKALETMSKRIGESLRRGTGPALEALTDLGLNIETIAEMDPAQAFREISRALQGVESTFKRNAIAANLFSKANQTLLNLLAAGPESIDQMTRRAEQLGITYSRFDASKVEAANDAILSTKEAVRGLAIQGAIDLAPFVKLFADDLTNAIIGVQNPLRSLKDNTRSVTEEFGLLGAGTLQLIDLFHRGRIAWMELSLEFHKGVQRMASPLSMFEGARVLMPEGVREAWGEVNETIGGLALKPGWFEDIQLVEDELARLSKIDPAENAKERVREFREELKGTAHDAQAAGVAMGAGFESTAAGIQTALAATMEYERAIKGADQAGRAAKFDEIQAMLGGSDIAKSFEQLNKDLDNAIGIEAFNEWEERLRQMQQDMAEAAGKATIGNDGAVSVGIEHAAKVLAEWQQKVADFGKTTRQAQFDAIDKAIGEDPLGAAFVEPLRRLKKQLADLEKGADLSDWADRMRENLETPWDNAVEAVQRLRDSVSQGIVTSGEAEEMFAHITGGLDDVQDRLAQFAAARRGLDFGGVGQGTQEAARRQFEIKPNEQFEREALSQRDEMVDLLRQILNGQRRQNIPKRAPIG